MDIDISKVKFNMHGLVPAIVQEESGQVLMLAYMNEESLKKTIETGYTWFYSRSRQKLWQKGETSGNVQQVKALYYDCDGDALLVKVHQTGVACHTGTYSCFSGRRLDENKNLRNIFLNSDALNPVKYCRLMEKKFEELLNNRGES